MHIARHDTATFATITAATDEYFYSSVFANLYHFYSTAAAQFLYVGITLVFLGIAASLSSMIVR